MTKGQQNTFGRGKRGENEDQLEYPPLTSEIERQLDPSYVAFYNNDVRGRRKEDPLPFATGSIPPVSSSQDFSIERRSSEGPDIGLRRFVPPGTQPPSGWPLVLYFHGGGWVGGNLDTENALCRNICVQSRAVVVTVGYR
jgi:triacylglycerol lipase